MSHTNSSVFMTMRPCQSAREGQPNTVHPAPPPPPASPSPCLSGKSWGTDKGVLCTKSWGRSGETTEDTDTCGRSPPTTGAPMICNHLPRDSGGAWWTSTSSSFQHQYTDDENSNPILCSVKHLFFEFLVHYAYRNTRRPLYPMMRLPPEW